MKIIKLDYFTLLSPVPIDVHGVGHIISPTLKSIAELGYSVYNIYLDSLLTNVQVYYEFLDKHGELYFAQHTPEQKELIIKTQQEYNNLSDEGRYKLSFFDILIFDPFYIKRVLSALNFFIIENVTFNEKLGVFLIYDTEDINEGTQPIGCLHNQNYEAVVDLILQRVCMNRDGIYTDNVKIKNKLASKLLAKIKNGAKKRKGKKPDKKMELANIISSLATHSKALNMYDIWNLTVYQLLDQFKRQQVDDSYAISASHVSAWGDKDNKFDSSSWLSLLNEN